MVQLTSSDSFPIKAWVGQVVGDADAVKTAFAVKINNLRHGQLAIGIIGMNVKIAKQHLRMAAVSIQRRNRTHDALWRAVKKFDGPASGMVVFRFGQDEFGNAQRGVRTAHLPEVFMPLRPLRGFFGEGVFHQLGHLAVFFRNRAQAETPDQFGVAFLLAGDDLVDNHRAARGDGFLHGRAAGFANDQMV